MHDPFISDGIEDLLHVVCVISNPERYRSRPELYVAFEKYMRDSGVVLYTVELQFGERKFEITSRDNPRHIQLRTGGPDRKGHEIWHKENLINIGISRLPKEAKYIAWIDADVTFARPDWAVETVQQLQHFDFLQLFSHAQDVGPDCSPVKSAAMSFCYVWTHHRDKLEWNSKDYSKGAGHPGYAWACRRDALEKVGGLIDWAVLGSADRHMAYALVDHVENSYHPEVHPVYKKMCKIWQVRCRHYIHRNIGYVPGMLLHHWHGGKASRQYSSRWRILVDEQFNPDLDLKRDAAGVLQLTERNWRLRDKVRQYFRARNEDDIRVD